MGILQKVGREFKGIAQNVGSMSQFPGYGYGGHFGSNPLMALLRGEDDEPLDGMDTARDIHNNSVVNISLRYIARHFGLAESLIQNKKEKDWETLADHPLYRLLQVPNDYYDGGALLAATSASLAMGNGYWLLSRDAAGNPAELWWSPQLYSQQGVFGCTPYSEPNFNNGLPFCYLYRVNGLSHYLPIEDVIHFRLPLPDPLSPFIGENPMDSQRWQIGVDNQISQYTYFIAKNSGVVGALFTSADENVSVTEGAIDKLKRNWREMTTGRNRGGAGFLPTTYDVKFPDTSPDKMAIEVLGDTAEERIPAAFGLNAIALNLGAGLDKSTYNNGEQAHRAAYDGGIAPLHKIVAQTITNKLLPQFTTAKRPGEVAMTATKTRFFFDDSNVPSQQEDENAKHERLRADWEKNLITLGEWYMAVGKPIPAGVNEMARFVDFQPAPPAPSAPQLKAGDATNMEIESKKLPDAEARTPLQKALKVLKDNPQIADELSEDIEEDPQKIFESIEGMASEQELPFVNAKLKT